MFAPHDGVRCAIGNTTDANIATDVEHTNLVCLSLAVGSTLTRSQPGDRPGVGNPGAAHTGIAGISHAGIACAAIGERTNLVGIIARAPQGVNTECMNRAGKTPEEVASILRNVAGWTGWFQFLAFYFLNVQVCDFPCETEHERKYVRDSMGVSGWDLEIIHGGN